MICSMPTLKCECHRGLRLQRNACGWGNVAAGPGDVQGPCTPCPCTPCRLATAYLDFRRRRGKYPKYMTQIMAIIGPKEGQSKETIVEMLLANNNFGNVYAVSLSCMGCVRAAPVASTSCSHASARCQGGSSCTHKCKLMAACYHCVCAGVQCLPCPQDGNIQEARGERLSSTSSHCMHPHTPLHPRTIARNYVLPVRAARGAAGAAGAASAGAAGATAATHHG